MRTATGAGPTLAAAVNDAYAAPENPALPARAETPAELNDLEIAHVAYTADLIDIRYAYLAMAVSKNPGVMSSRKR